VKPSLVGCREKLRRADSDIHELDAGLRDYEDPLGVTAHLDLDASGQKGKCVVELAEFPPPIPPDHLVLVGMIVHNMRCALDYLAYEMTALGKGRYEDSEWPIADDPALITWRGKETLKRLTPEHRAIVEGSQPYKAGNIDFKILRELSNQDKHRLLIATVRQISFDSTDFFASVVTPFNCCLALEWVNGGSLKPGAPVIRYSVLVDGKNPRVSVNNPCGVHVALEEANWRAVDVLASIRTKIVKAVEEVAKDFPA
jgi:hypothetical protein